MRQRRRITAEHKKEVAKWAGYRGGYAWVLLYCGFPCRIRVLPKGRLEDHPGHISLCSVVSRTRGLKLYYGASPTCDWWVLRNKRTGKLVASRRQPAGTMFRRLNPPKHKKRITPSLVVVGAEATALLERRGVA